MIQCTQTFTSIIYTLITWLLENLNENIIVECQNLMGLQNFTKIK